MSQPDIPEEAPPQPVREPFFRLPAAVSGTIAVLGLVHLVRLVLPIEADDWLIRAFAFIPLRLTGEAAELFPGGTAGAVWTLLTYALIHADLGHILVNGFWLAAFGSPLAERLGPLRFVGLSAAGALGGALLHLATHWGDLQPVIGASAAVSAHLAATCRFAFARGGPLSGAPAPSPMPAPPLMRALADRRVLTFLGSWFGINLLFGLLSMAEGGPLPNAIAWEAHVGGFAVGLLAFQFFDPIRQSAEEAPPPEG